MKLSTRLFASLCLAYILIVVPIIFLLNIEMRRQALLDAEEKAGIIIARDLAVHNYFTEELKPKLLAWAKSLQADGYLEPSLLSSTYAVHRIHKHFNMLSSNDYYIKTCARNARNPENEADAYEMTFLDSLNANPAMKKQNDIMYTEGKPYFVLMHRGLKMEEACLHCHGKSENAPADLVQRYGLENGFHRKLGDTVSAISIRIPLEAAYAETKRLSLWLSGLFAFSLFALFLVQYYLSRRFLLRPLAMVHGKALEIAASDEYLGEVIPVPAGRELANLTLAFNQMSKNLKDRTEELKRLNAQFQNDIAAKKAFEQVVQQEKEKFQLLFQLAPLGVSIIGRDGRYLHVNSKFVELFGYRIEEIPTGRDWFARAYPDPIIRQKALSAWIKDLKQSEAGERRPRTFSVTCKDGTEKIVHFITVSLENGDQFVTYEDITERRRFEEQLRQANEYLEGLLENSPDAIGIVDRHGRFIKWNRMAVESYGYSLDELSDSSAFQLYASKDELDRMLAKLRREGAVKGYEIRMRTKDRGSVPFELSISLLKDEQNRTIGSICIARDVSDIRRMLNELKEANEKLSEEIAERQKIEEALRKSENTYRTIFETTGAATVIIEEDTIIALANSECEKLSGYSREDIEGKKSWTEIVAADDVQVMKERHYARRADPSAAPRKYEFRIIDKNGKPKQVLATVGMIPGTSRSVASFIDITDQKRLEAELLRVQKIESLGVLAGGVAHDFNNILAATIGYTELALLGASQGDPIESYLEQILHASLRAKDLVKQILAFSRQSKVERTPVQVSTIIKEALKLIRASLPTTITIRQDIRSPSTLVLADPTQLHQVLMNLCTNSAHAMRERGGILDVSLSEVNLRADDMVSPVVLKPGNYLRLSVKDTGVGMNAKIRERIFEPYFTTKEKGIGTGLGLAVVHGIVKNHGGAITVYSEEGKGSRFDVYLPVITRRKMAVKEVSVPMPGGSESILFVDDEAVLVDIGRQALEHLGYRVSARTSSIEALEVFRAQPDAFDLVITDMTMPNMTGKELSRELIRIRPNIPVVLCTGFSETISEEEAKEMGVREFVLKPVIIRDLADTVRRILDEQKRARQDNPQALS